MRSNKLFKFLVFVCLLAPSKVVSQEVTESVTYTFNSADWGVVDSDINNSDWVSIIDAAYHASYLCLQVPAKAVCANSPVYFSNINKVIVSYNSTVEGEIKINCVETPNAAADSGTPLVASNNVAITGMNAFYDIVYTPQHDNTSGYIQIYATCESNAIYIKSVTVVYTPVTPLPQLSFEKDVYRKTVQAGEQFQIKASSPFFNNSISYNSTNQIVACVDEEGRVTALSPGSTIISASVDDTEYYSGQRIAYALTVVEPNCDLLTASLFSATDTHYKNFSNVKNDGDNGIKSGSVYKGRTATDQYGSIGIRNESGEKDNCPGIITTTSGGMVRKIKVEWNENNTNGASLQIYGRSYKFNYISDMKSGTTIGTLTYGKSTTLNLNTPYKFIGISGKSGTCYLKSIKIFWDAKPLMSLASGTYTSQQDVTITSMQDTYIIYTTDNSEPSLDNGIRTDGNSVTLTINSDCTLKAVAVDNDNVVTPVASESYKFVTIAGDGSFDNPYTTADVRTLYNEKLYNTKRYVWIKGIVGGDTNLTLGDVQVSATGDDYLYDVISDNRGKDVVVCGKIDKSSSVVVLKSIIKVSGLCDMPITTKEGYGTFYNDYAYEMPEGVVGYIITDADKTSNKLTLEQVYTGKDLVPSGTSLLLKGEYKTYPVNVISTSKSKPTNNLLHGADCVDADGKTWVEGTDVKYYILSYGQEDKALKFHYAVAGGGPIKYQKPYAFLAIDGGTSSRAKGFSFLDNDVSGISDHIIESLQTDKYVYTIEGIRVDHERLAKGLYIVNGKKLYVK